MLNIKMSAMSAVQHGSYHINCLTTTLRSRLLIAIRFYLQSSLKSLRIFCCDCFLSVVTCMHI